MAGHPFSVKRAIPAISIQKIGLPKSVYKGAFARMFAMEGAHALGKLRVIAAHMGNIVQIFEKRAGFVVPFRLSGGNKLVDLAPTSALLFVKRSQALPPFFGLGLSALSEITRPGFGLPRFSMLLDRFGTDDKLANGSRVASLRTAGRALSAETFEADVPDILPEPLLTRLLALVVYLYWFAGRITSSAR